MPDLTVSSNIDTLLTKQSLADAKTYLGVTANETAITTEATARQAADLTLQADVAFNTAKVGITPAQASAIEANTVKTGITLAQANAITANTAKVGITPTQASAITANTAKVGITSEQADAIVANTAKVGITPTQASAITLNTAKVGITPSQASAIVANTAKVGITPSQASAITANTTAISTETTRATSAEGQLNTAIAAEISRAQTAEQGNATDIATNATDIAAETTRATAAEQANATDIATNAGNITSNAIRGINNEAAISTETTRALAAEALLAPIDDATFTGTTTIPSADITTANFNAGALDGGELSWNGQERTLNLVTGTDTTIQIGQELVLYATNDSGVTIPHGSVVSIDGSQGNKPTIVLAQADTVTNARKTIGITTESIPDNSSGFVTLNGKVRNLVLDGGTYGSGQVVYLSSTVAGGITNIQPDITVELGHVLATSTGGNTGGVIEVQINNESAVHELEQQVPHNSESIIICNDGDNIQEKYDEAVALATGGLYGYADLIVMSGSYSGITGTGNNNVSIIGVGNRDHIEIGGITLDQNYGLITNVKSNISITSNYADIKGVHSGSNFSMLENFGDIIDCSAPTFLSSVENFGLIEGCESTGNIRAFGGFNGSLNNGTIKNCTAAGDLSFGQQDANGVTENCVGAFRAFAGASNSINFSNGGIEGTYKNCKGGNESFFGRNTKTDAAVEMEATYENCTGGDKSFGFVESAPASGNVGPKTVFAGTAKNCTGGSSSFASSWVAGAQAEIKDGAVIENCTAKNKSFATNSDPNITTCINYGNVIRSRCTGASGFSATGTGKVRLCLDQNFDEINLP